MNKSYDNNTKAAKRYKQRYEKSNDTILQRGNEYVKILYKTIIYIG